MFMVRLILSNDQSPTVDEMFFVKFKSKSRCFYFTTKQCFDLCIPNYSIKS